jgi:hypothetical protein
VEAADPEVSFELLLRGLLATGATKRDVANAFDHATTPPKRKRRQRSVLPRSPAS